MKISSHFKSTVTVFLLFLLALILRLYGLDWDQGQHLHPDERFLTMVVNDIRLPQSISEYLNTEKSPLNPYNYSSYQFFVYGTFPVFLVKYLSVFLHLDDYDHIQLVGRAASAFFDSLNIIFLFLLVRKIFSKHHRLRFLPSILYTFCILPLQLSHFFAVDTFLTTLILITFTFLAYDLFIPAAITLGLALSCKITAIIFLPIIFIFLLRQSINKKSPFPLILITAYCLPITFLVFRFFQPYAFIGLKINPLFIDNLRQLKQMASSQGLFPPSVQWLNRFPLGYSLQNIAIFGLGLPMSIIFFISLIKYKKHTYHYLLVYSLVWIIVLYIYQGSQFTHCFRYFLPIYPFLFIIITYTVAHLNRYLSIILIVLHLSLGILSLSIYSRPHSRVQASLWIYQYLPSGSRITNEYWDDPLPLYLPGHDPNIYQGTMLPLYDPDSSQKWLSLQTQLNNADYLIMSSNRLWRSISRVPDKYPVTAAFYRDLFAGRTDFQKLIEINSYPGLSLPFLGKCIYFGPTDFPGQETSWMTVDGQCLYPGIYLRDDIAEESFTVYDHPKVLIFKRQY